MFCGQVPDILVLQLGTFEASPSLIHGRLNWLRSSSSSSQLKKDGLPPVDPDSVYHISILQAVKQLVKQVIHGILAYSLLPKKRLAAEIDAFFGLLAKKGVKQVIVMSPLPSLDPTLQHYRDQVFGLMKKATRNSHVVVYDATYLRGMHHLYLPDGMHLNRHGHEFLGREIGQLITCMVGAKAERGVVLRVA
jgi:hypothetical protein